MTKLNFSLKKRAKFSLVFAMFYFISANGGIVHSAPNPKRERPQSQHNGEDTKQRRGVHTSPEQPPNANNL